MSGPGLRPLMFGTLPTAATLRIVEKYEGKVNGMGAEALHRELQAMLRRGEMAALRVLLERIGFEWGQPTVMPEVMRKAVSS